MQLVEVSAPTVSHQSAIGSYLVRRCSVSMNVCTTENTSVYIKRH